MKKATGILILALMTVGILSVGGILAYFTDGDTATNTFTIGKVEIDLQEPSFKESEAVDLVPCEEITKDPQVKNTGINDAYIFMSVQIPVSTIKTVSDDGTVSTAAKATQLFSYSPGTDWTLLTSGVTGGKTVSLVNKTGTYGVTGSDSVTYYYAYTGSSASSLEALAAGKTTTALFSKVKFVNAVEETDLEGSTKDIVINTYAIQTENLKGGTGNDLSDPATVWALAANSAPSTDKSGENESTDIVA